MKTQEKLLAVCSGADICVEDHGIPYLNTSFEYDDGGSFQGLGAYMLDGAFVFRFMNALGISELSQAKGTSVWIVKDEKNSISEIHPLHKKNGASFVIKDWQEWVNKRGTNVSASEMASGIDPKSR